ncbi:MAG: CidA/LrgA family protein [Alphaproteobacteria bacterium]|nr:CidA/LrgA family protein [Alphaproteobacteria bacterium]
MKYLFQFAIILLFVFLGELCEYIIPLPIAGSIWGLMLMFVALWTRVIRLEWVADVADWMHGIMSLFFIVPAAAVIDVWGDISNIWWMLVLLMIIAYVVTMVMTGVTADYFLEHRNIGGRKK